MYGKEFGSTIWYLWYKKYIQQSYKKEHEYEKLLNNKKFCDGSLQKFLDDKYFFESNKKEIFKKYLSSDDYIK
jgi:hypothetical protein